MKTDCPERKQTQLNSKGSNTPNNTLIGWWPGGQEARWPGGTQSSTVDPQGPPLFHSMVRAELSIDACIESIFRWQQPNDRDATATNVAENSGYHIRKFWMSYPKILDIQRTEFLKQEFIFSTITDCQVDLLAFGRGWGEGGRGVGVRGKILDACYGGTNSPGNTFVRDDSPFLILKGESGLTGSPIVYTVGNPWIPRFEPGSPLDPHRIPTWIPLFLTRSAIPGSPADQPTTDRSPADRPNARRPTDRPPIDRSPADRPTKRPPNDQSNANETSARKTER